MRRRKLNYIEAYIYAKTLYLISSNTEIPQNNQKIMQFIIKTTHLSKKLLSFCENKINKLKLNNASFLLLKQQLEEIDYPHSTLINYSKIKEMLKKYDYYFSLIA